MLTKKPAKKERRDPREERFYAQFFGVGVQTSKGNSTLSAVLAGYDEDKAAAVGNRLIEALDKASFKKVLANAGLTKSNMALIIKDAIAQSGPKELTANIRVALKLMGEMEEGAQASTTQVNISGAGAQILVVEGATAEKMRALRAGKPTLPPKETSE